MSNQLAILLGSIIIALAIVFSPSERYQIASSMDASGIPTVWRLDVRTGDVDTCVVSRNPLAKLQQGPPPGECSVRAVRLPFWRRFLR
jgi:hypothetical protein